MVHCGGLAAEDAARSLRATTARRRAPPPPRQPFYDENNAKLFELIKRGEFECVYPRARGVEEGEQRPCLEPPPPPSHSPFVASFPSPYWDGVSESAKDLVRHCLVVLPAYRFSAAEVLQHPWIVGGGVSARSGVAAPLHIAEQLQRFNARQKFREGVRKVQALARFKSLGAMRGKDAPVVLIASKGVAAVRLGEASAAASEAAAPAVVSRAASSAGAGAGASAGAGAAPSRPPATLPTYYEPPAPTGSAVYGGMAFPGKPPTPQQLYSFSLAPPGPPPPRAALYADQSNLFDLEKF